MDDVLRVRETPCPCGRASLALAGIDGRRDAVLMLPVSGTRAAVDDADEADDADDAETDPRRLTPGNTAAIRSSAIETRASAQPATALDRAIFPDVLRRAMMLASGDSIRDYRIVQTGEGLVVRLDLKAGGSELHAQAQAQARARAEAAVRAELDSLFAQQGVIAPPIAFASGNRKRPATSAAAFDAPRPALRLPSRLPTRRR